jgi:hypothetical protein
MQNKNNTTPTGRKLDWMRCVRFDRRLTAYQRLVLLAIIDRVDLKKGKWQVRVSDKSIADDIGGSWRSVQSARMAGAKHGWLGWVSTPNHVNEYRIRLDQMDQYLALISQMRVEVKQAQKRRNKWMPTVTLPSVIDNAGQRYESTFSLPKELSSK